MKNNFLSFILSLFILMVGATVVWAHCEIPCGLYDDKNKVAELNLDIDTIEKSIQKITELSSAESVDYNQIVRWVTNKDKHADHLKEEIATYFLSQRVKFPASNDDAATTDYENKLKRLHEVIVYAMKTKQSLDLKNIQDLRASFKSFETLYFAEHS